MFKKADMGMRPGVPSSLPPSPPISLPSLPIPVPSCSLSTPPSSFFPFPSLVRAECSLYLPFRPRQRAPPPLSFSSRGPLPPSLSFHRHHLHDHDGHLRGGASGNLPRVQKQISFGGLHGLRPRKEGGREGGREDGREEGREGKASLGRAGECLVIRKAFFRHPSFSTRPSSFPRPAPPPPLPRAPRPTPPSLPPSLPPSHPSSASRSSSPSLSWPGRSPPTTL
jgi:hypothetical protein